MLETVEMSFQHLKGPGNREPQLIKVQQSRGEVAEVCCCGKSKEMKVVRCASRVFMYSTPRAIPFSAWQLCPILEIISNP